MRVEIAPQVAKPDELRQDTVPRRLELAQVLAELRWDVLVAQEVVERLLAAGLEDLAGLDLLDAVLRDREPSPDGVLTQRDVVVL